jgi:hypothetical protein
MKILIIFLMLFSLIYADENYSCNEVLHSDYGTLKIKVDYEISQEVFQTFTGDICEEIQNYENRFGMCNCTEFTNLTKNEDVNNYMSAMCELLPLSIFESNFLSCKINVLSVNNYHLFDSYDTFRGDVNNDKFVSENESRQISTKITDKDFNLTLGSFIDSQYKLGKTENNVTVKYNLVSCPNSDTNNYDECTNITDNKTFYSNTNMESTETFNVKDPYKIVAVHFTACGEDINGVYKLYPYKDCEDSKILSYINILSTDKFAIRPKEFILSSNNILEKSGEDFNITIDSNESNYNLNSADKNLTISYIGYDKNDNEVDLNGDVKFTNKFDINKSGTTSVEFSDIGKIQIQISDENFSNVDADDTNESLRFITGYITKQFIPYSIYVEQNTVNLFDKWTYLANEINSTSTSFDLNISIKNKQNNNCKNFDLIWNNKISIKLTPSEPNSLENNITNKVLEFNDGVCVLDSNKSLLSYNYKREVNKVQNPFKSTCGINVSTDYNDTVISVKTISSDTIFLYGKLHIQNKRIIGKSGNTKAYVEIFCNSDKSLLPDGLNSKFSDDPRWFINSLHAKDFGKINNITQKNNNVIDASVNDFNIGLTLQDKVSMPYKGTMEINSSKWLIYNKYFETNYNYFDVKFISDKVNWAGMHETNTTTKINASKNTNRRTFW